MFLMLLFCACIQSWAPNKDCFKECFGQTHRMCHESGDYFEQCSVCGKVEVRCATPPQTLEKKAEKIKHEFGISFDAKGELLFNGHKQDEKSIRLIENVFAQSDTEVSRMLQREISEAGMRQMLRIDREKMTSAEQTLQSNINATMANIDTEQALADKIIERITTALEALK